MKDQNYKDEVTKILEEAPSARKALQENYQNLLNVADYCYNTYTQVGTATATIKAPEHLNTGCWNQLVITSLYSWSLVRNCVRGSEDYKYVLLEQIFLSFQTLQIALW